MKRPKPKFVAKAKPEALEELYVRQGQVVHYNGLPFYVAIGVSLLGSRGNVTAALQAQAELAGPEEA